LDYLRGRGFRKTVTPFLQLILALVFIILAAKAGGYLSYRLGQPTVLGELLVGVVLGPTVVDLLHLPFFSDEHMAETIHHLAEVGVMVLMFIAGLELHLSDLAKSGKVAALAGVLGVVFPLILGAGTAMILGMAFLPALFIGLVLSATSVSISAQTLIELNVLRSRVGIGLLGAAVFDDVLVVLGLSVFVALTQSGSGGGLGSVAVILLQMVLYLGIASILGWLLLPRLSSRVTNLPISQGLVAFTFIVILLYGWAAEVVGNMAAITGAFLAGLMLARSPVKERIENGVSILAYAVFVPIFFVNVGLSANARELTGDGLLLLATLTLVAVVGKVLGSGLGASLSGFTRRESLQLGVGMMSRGEVGLIVASVGITAGLISQEIFSAIVGVVILTTLLTPPLLRALYAGGKSPQGAAVESRPVNKPKNRPESRISTGSGSTEGKSTGSKAPKSFPEGE
jgi:Kef-type K+ transport system membrane component KefB